MLIRAVGPMETVHPRTGGTFTLEELQGFVGGYIEALRMATGQIMWLNEDGKSMGLPVNLIADLIAHDSTGIAPHDHIVGDVLVASLAECDDEEPPLTT